MVNLAADADTLAEAMLRSALILLTLPLQLACSLLPASDLKTPIDDIRRVAQDLRWTKQNRAIAKIDLATFTPPVAILAVPSGTHALHDLEQLVPTEQGREWLRRMAGGHALTTDGPTLCILAANQKNWSYLHDDASIPKPVGLWKQSPGDVSVLLERHGDDVQIVGLQ